MPGRQEQRKKNFFITFFGGHSAEETRQGEGPRGRNLVQERRAPVRRRPGVYLIKLFTAVSYEFSE